ncbi:hypothetical protein NPS29_12780 [Pseudomonas putida]|uniref:hypothetical protein n=1 Tax=Pseudomonas putida TaxID=303 RepID=UPI0023642B0E|nr:hypothetical protein [Pseudomonas putida]MDD1966197.1 hypothetical protein [Pseudomonas putida]
MHASQSYVLTIKELYTVSQGRISGAVAEVAILDKGVEVDRVNFSGLCRSPDGYSRKYEGKPGLAAVITKGPGSVTMAMSE